MTWNVVGLLIGPTLNSIVTKPKVLTREEAKPVNVIICETRSHFGSCMAVYIVVGIRLTDAPLLTSALFTLNPFTLNPFTLASTYSGRLWRNGIA